MGEGGCADLVLTVDDAGAPAGNAASWEVTEAPAETVAPIALAFSVERSVFGIAIATGGRHLRDRLGLLGVLVCVRCEVSTMGPLVEVLTRLT